jgi:NitT/TauT family transport system ATP-binding protein
VSEVVVEVKSLMKSFSRPDTAGPPTTIFENIAFSVSKGELLTIIGPSGCGKTTLLNCIAGLIKPTQGTITIDEKSMNGTPSKDVAYMLARDALLPWRTAQQNVQLAMEVGGRTLDKGRAVQLLEMVGMGGFEKHFPSQLSHGMRQRVALARTLAIGADLWLLDEPFAALDANTRMKVHGVFSNIWEQERKAALLVTHDLVEAILLSDRIMVMSAGPGVIKSLYTVDIPRPRQILDLQGTDVFTELYRTLWNDLREEMN